MTRDTVAQMYFIEQLEEACDRYLEKGWRSKCLELPPSTLSGWRKGNLPDKDRIKEVLDSLKQIPVRERDNLWASYCHFQLSAQLAIPANREMHYLQTRKDLAGLRAETDEVKAVNSFLRTVRDIYAAGYWKELIQMGENAITFLLTHERYEALHIIYHVIGETLINLTEYAALEQWRKKLESALKYSTNLMVTDLLIQSEVARKAYRRDHSAIDEALRYVHEVDQILLHQEHTDPELKVLATNARGTILRRKKWFGDADLAYRSVVHQSEALQRSVAFREPWTVIGSGNQLLLALDRDPKKDAVRVLQNLRRLKPGLIDKTSFAECAMVEAVALLTLDKDAEARKSFEFGELLYGEVGISNPDICVERRYLYSQFHHDQMLA